MIPPKNRFSARVLPISILSGTIIGAGMFSLPFIFSASGWLVGVVYLIAFVAVFSFLHLMYADIIIGNGGQPKLAEYVARALGGWAFWPMATTTVAGMFLILTIYLVLSTSFANLLAPEQISAPRNLGTILIFWLLGSAALFLGVKKLAFSEFLVNIAVAAIVIVIFSAGLKELSSGNETAVGLLDSALPRSFGPYALFLPFGPVLFSLAGRSAVPSVVKYARKLSLPRDILKKNIIWGTAVPAFIYLLFVFGVTFLSKNITTDAVSGIVYAPKVITYGLGILGLAVMWSTYIMVGASLKDILIYDLRVPPFASGAIVVFAPLALYLAGLQNFLALVSIAGGIFVAIEGLALIFTWQKLRKTNGAPSLFEKSRPNIVSALIAIFIIGLVCEIIYFVN